MVYVNEILECVVNRDKNTPFEVSRIIVDRDLAEKIKNDLCTIKVDLRFDKYDGVLFNTNIKTIPLSKTLLDEICTLPCMVFDLFTPDGDNTKSHILFATNIK